MVKNKLPSLLRVRARATYRCVGCKVEGSRRWARVHECRLSKAQRKRVRQWKRRNLALGITHAFLPTAQGRLIRKATRRVTIYAIKGR